MEDIIHLDMDAFYAAIEERDHPEYRNRPLVVAFDGPRSVVSTANYEARKYKIFSALPLYLAKKQCSSLIIVNPDFKKYNRVSKQIYHVLETFTPDIEQSSIDEFYLDIKASHLLFGSSPEIAKKIKQEIYKNLQITCSIGISYNKLLAKMASDMQKPDGLTHISKSNCYKIINNLKIDKIPGLGKKSTALLHKKEIFTIEQLRKLSLTELNRLFGIHGYYYYNACRGIGENKLTLSKDTKSISNEITLHQDTRDKQIIKKVLLRLSDHLADRIRKKNLKGKVIKIKLRYYNFKTISKQISLQKFIHTSEDLFNYSYKLIDDLITQPIRLIGIGLSSLNDESKHSQLKLFNDNKEKKDIEKNMGQINEQFDEKLIKRGSLL